MTTTRSKRESFLMACMFSMLHGSGAHLFGEDGPLVTGGGVVNKVEREDGSGYRFNVYLNTGKTIYVGFDSERPVVL